MEKHSYKLLPRGWSEVESSYPVEVNSMIWDEIRYVETPDISRLVDRFDVEVDLLEYFMRTDASFVSNESNVFFLLATRSARFDGTFLAFDFLIIGVAEGKFVTVESVNSRVGPATRQKWNTEGIKNRADPWTVLAAFLDEFADSYRPVVESMEDSVLAMEERLAEEPLDKQQLMVLFRMRRQLIMLQRIVDPVSDLVGRWSAGSIQSRNEAPDFSSAYEELQRLDRRVDGLWKVVTSVVEMSNLLEQQRQGLASRKLTAWAGIVAVPTALAGIFGMNFPRLPLLDVENGHWIALSMMTGISTGLLLRFRKIGWL